MNNKKQTFMIIGIFALILTLTSVTYAFFNYTRTGGLNNLGTGTISFNTIEGPALNMTNLFPMTSEEAGEANLDSLTIDIEGNTTYSGGEEYVISLVDINNTINGKEVPMNYIASYVAKENETIGTNNGDSYWEDRNDQDANIYVLYNEGKIIEDKHVLVGYIDNDGTGISGTLTIKAYIDADRIAISDTYYENAPAPSPSAAPITGPNDAYGTSIEWVNGRVVLTTEEWNSIQSNPISFKVRAESNEGIWAKEQLSRNDMKNFNFAGTFTSQQKSSFTEVNFIRMSKEEINTHADAIDLTDPDGQGLVKAWIDGTKLYIASPGETYFPENCSGLFVTYTNMASVNFNNVNLSEVVYMSGMFNNTGLVSIDLSNMDTHNVRSMDAMFATCPNLTYANLSNLGSNILSNLSGLFSGDTNLVTIVMNNFDFGTSYMASLFAGLSTVETISLQGVKTGRVEYMQSMFSGCSSLTSLDLSSFDTSSATSLNSMFSGCSSLTSLDLSSFDTSKVFYMDYLFNGCTSLTSINLSSFDTSIVTGMRQMFNNCTSLTTLDLSSFDTSAVTDSQRMFAMGTYKNSTWTPYDNSLTTIYVGSSWNVANADYSYGMFYNCTHLVGGSGTTYDGSTSLNYDKGRAIVDGGTSNPGYLTLKTS